MLEPLHYFLSQVLFGADSDLGWSGVRAVTGICSLIAARAVFHSPDRFLTWATLFLAVWLGLKVADDLTHRSHGGQLTTYFLAANLAWSVILIGLARMANREQVHMRVSR
jgi:hypothetical protein